MSTHKRNKYMGGYKFWNANRFWNSMPRLSKSGRQYYENWLENLKQNDKLLQKTNDL